MSSLGGLNSQSGSNSLASGQRSEWILAGECELRCEVPEGESLYLKLIEGTAEIFGIEMAVSKEYEFKDVNFAVFTWYGCKIESKGSNSSVYRAESTPNSVYVNVHAQLESRRDVALANQDYGPRVLFVGDVDHGKSSTSRMLAAYAARLDRSPIYIDLDVGQNSITVPGGIAAVQVDKATMNIEEAFTHAMPLIYYYGHAAPGDNVELYKHCITTMAKNVRARMDNDLDTKASGCIINTCGWVDGIGYDVILHIITTFDIDVILVMNHDKLYSSLWNYAQGKPITVVKLPTSGGIVRRDTPVRRKQRKNLIKEYFYGKSHIPSLMLSPARMDLKLSNVIFIKPGGIQLSEGMKSMDDKVISPTELIVIHPTIDLLNSVLGVLQPSELGNNGMMDHDANDLPKDLIESNIAGFIVIVQMNIEQNSMTILSPCPGMLPSKYLLVGSIKWVEK